MARAKGARGWAASGIKSIAEGPNGRCGMAATECVALREEWLAGATTWGRMMWRIRNREGLKRGGGNRNGTAGRSPRTERFT